MGKPMNTSNYSTLSTVQHRGLACSGSKLYDTMYNIIELDPKKV